MLLASWNFDTVLKRFRFFNAESLGSVSQRASKLLAVKVWGLKKKSASRPRPQSASLPRFEPRSRSNHSQSLMAGNFAALWPTDPKSLALKDLNPFKTVSKVQKTSSILRVGFALSKWPHLHRAYVVGGCLFNFGTVATFLRENNPYVHIYLVLKYCEVCGFN